jgi:hypothetical protein
MLVLSLSLRHNHPTFYSSKNDQLRSGTKLEQGYNSGDTGNGHDDGYGPADDF